MEEFSPQNLVNELMLERTSNVFEAPYLVLNEMHRSSKQLIMGHVTSIRQVLRTLIQFAAQSTDATTFSLSTNLGLKKDSLTSPLIKVLEFKIRYK